MKVQADRSNVPDPEWLRAQTERIDTGTGDNRTRRALVVWNLGGSVEGGVAIFHADYTLRTEMPLPIIRMVDFEGRSVASAVRNHDMQPDAETGRIRHRFALAFAHDPMPARSWKVYWAEYMVEGGELISLPNIDPTPEVVVLETLCHGGDLAPWGTF